MSNSSVVICGICVGPPRAALRDAKRVKNPAADPRTTVPPEPPKRKRGRPRKDEVLPKPLTTSRAAAHRTHRRDARRGANPM